nr:MAG TPA: hypothetical protein [Caudoviricetes sp.]
MIQCMQYIVLFSSIFNEITFFNINHYRVFLIAQY